MRKGIKINAELGTIEEVTIGNDFTDIQKVIGCDCFTCVAYDEHHDIYVDDEGLLKDPEHFFLYRGYPAPLAGNGFILGTDHNTGKSKNAKVTVDEVRKNVKFLNADTVRMLSAVGMI